MKTYLVTGCAGFIGSNFVHYMLEKYEDIRLVNLDKLTYAGNLENLQDIEDDARHIFVQGDICDKALVTDLIAKYDPDYVINFAAESHVDRSIKNPEIFVESNVLGTVNLLQCCKDAWYDAAAKTWKEGKKYLQVSTDEVYGALGAEGYFMETTPLCPHSPYSASKASADMFVKAFHDTYGMPMNIGWIIPIRKKYFPKKDQELTLKWERKKLEMQKSEEPKKPNTIKKPKNNKSLSHKTSN